MEMGNELIILFRRNLPQDFLVHINWTHYLHEDGVQAKLAEKNLQINFSTYILQASVSFPSSVVSICCTVCRIFILTHCTSYKYFFIKDIIIRLKTVEKYTLVQKMLDLILTR